MKKQLSFFVISVCVGILALTSTSCKKDTPAPTVRLLAQVSGHTVTLTYESTDATTYAWDYGDGKTSTVSTLSHTHTYDFSGTYTVKITATGGGGTIDASQTVTIDPIPSEILAGTPATHPNGKTWVLDPKYYSGKNGAGPIIPGLPITLDFLVDNILQVQLGLGVEYDNEFTFKYDGKLTINNKNGVSLGSQMYAGVVLGTGPNPSYPGGMGICGMNYTPAASGTWQLKKETLTMPVVVEDPNNLAGGYSEATYTQANQTFLVPTDYIGFLDITKIVIVKEITSNYMHLVFLMHGVVQVPMKPSTALHITMKPKV